MSLLRNPARRKLRTGQATGQMVSRVVVYPEADVGALARAIEAGVGRVRATTAEGFDQAAP